MGTRGRRSMASLMAPDNPTEIVQRPFAMHASYFRWTKKVSRCSGPR
jgi:hypothetical protein